MNELELRDIHLPDASLWWPPAPGWWLLLLLMAILAAALVGFLIWLRHKPPRAYALRELGQIRNAFQSDQNKAALLGEISALLRRIMISYHGRQGFAASTGEDWLMQLKDAAPQPGFSPEQLRLLTRDRYRRDCDFDIESMFAACDRWIRSLPRSQARVSD